MPGPPSPNSRRPRVPRPRPGGAVAALLPLAESLERRLCLTTWYVSPYGSDIAPGTVDAPLGSLAAAAGHARAGDIVFVRAGTYSPGTSQVLASLGAADGRITFQAYPGEKPVIDGSSVANGAPVVDITGQYIDLNDIEIRNATGVGLAATGQHLRMINDTVHDARQQGILVGSSSNPNATNDVVVQSCYVYNDDLAAVSTSASTSTSAPVGSGAGSRVAGPAVAALEAYGATDVSFNNNFVHENDGPGIEMVLVDGGSAAGNLVHDNTGANLALDNATHLTIDQNFLYNTSETAYFTNGAPAVSIQLSNGAYPISNPLDFLLIENNITLSRSVNLRYLNVTTPPGSDAGLKDSTIANNAFYSGGGSGSINFEIDDSPGHANNVVVDNIFYQTNGAQVLFGTGSGSAGASAGGASTGNAAPAGFAFQDNNWFDGAGSAISQGGAGVAAGPGDLYSDPEFANPGSIDPAAYKIAVDSPDVDHGVAVNGVTTDFYGIPRPQGKLPDVGAHEVVTAPPAPTTVQAPPGAPPGVPAGVAATSPSSSEIDLTWGDYTAPLAGFDVQRRGNGDWIPVGYGSAGPGNATFAVTGAFSDTGLKPNHKYTYRIFAFFADNTVSAYSKSFTFKTAKKPKVVKPKVVKPKAPKPPKAPKAQARHGT